MPGAARMRGFDQRRDGLFSYVRPESRIPKNHPLRVIRALSDEALAALNDQFAALYSENGRPSIPPEQLLRALLLQAFYTIRSERQLMEQLNYNLLFRWFVGLSVDDPTWVPTVFSKNRDRHGGAGSSAGHAGGLPGTWKKTVGADKNYDTAAFVAASRELGVTSHMAQNITAHRGSNIDGHTTRRDGYRISQIIRKRIEEANGWVKEVGGMARRKFRGLARVGRMFTVKVAAYTLICLPRLAATG